MSLPTIALVMAVLAVWIISTRMRLTVMEENVRNAMRQIDVQLSSCLGALSALLALARPYAESRAQELAQRVTSCREGLTAEAITQQVHQQEELIAQVLAQLKLTAQQHPQLEGEENYAAYTDAAENFWRMVRTSRLIYNDGVTKLNRDVRTFPTCVIAFILGFRQREHIEAPQLASGPDGRNIPS